MKHSDTDVDGGETLSVSPRWRGASAIRLAHQLNAQAVDLICDIAIDSSVEAPWPFVSSNRDLWMRLDTVARRRLALFPFVIVDLRFSDEGWWEGQKLHREQMIVPVAFVGSDASGRREHLALEMLIFAWHVAREDRNVAQLLFAMTPNVAGCIARMTMQSIRMVAGEGTPHLRVRWDDEPQFWREFLICARQGDDSALAALRRDAKLLFCGELIHP